MSATKSQYADRHREIAGVLLLLVTALLFLALVTDGHKGDVRRSLSNFTEIPNFLGVAGAAVAGVLSMLVGPAAHVIYVPMLLWGIMLVQHRRFDRVPTRLLGLVLMTGSAAALCHMDLTPGASGATQGGAFGAFVADQLVPLFGLAGSNIIAGTFAIIGILLATEFLIVRAAILLYNLARMVVRWTAALLEALAAVWSDWRHYRVEDRATRRHDLDTG
ncbi:MAG TPA: hypothetical protein ENN80_10705, partial [Candidatus Hydrogenedentes bacterium]|nr:hypothetical protein [Candidatus Hydrogenedentota bacterium]